MPAAAGASGAHAVRARQCQERYRTHDAECRNGADRAVEAVGWDETLYKCCQHPEAKRKANRDQSLQPREPMRRNKQVT
jgi:hypothetical protein